MSVSAPLPTPEVFENLDFYTENGFRVFTAHYLKKRGYCCGSRCRHCPYGWENVPGFEKPKPKSESIIKK